MMNKLRDQRQEIMIATIVNADYRKATAFILVLSVLFVALLLAAPVAAAPTAQQEVVATISIPSINVSAPIVNIEIVNLPSGHRTWDTSTIRREVGFFVGTAWFGQGGNTVLGGHSELEYRSPTVFYELDQVQVGDEIIVTVDGRECVYIVTETFLVTEYDLWVIQPTSTERLTLMTCDITSYTEDGYSRRAVVVAEPVQTG